MGQNKVALISAEDLARHDPASGSTTQTFNRTSRANSAATVARTRLNASHVPLLDAALVPGARTPFDVLADTLAAKQVEAALLEVTKHQTAYKNFEKYGGIPGTGISAGDAVINTQIWNKILVDIAAEGRTQPGILFPHTYEFMETGGAMPTITAVPNITLVGAGVAAGMRRNAGASTALHLLDAIDCPGFVATNMLFDRNGTAGVGVAVRLSANAEQETGNVYIISCDIRGGSQNLQAGVSASPLTFTNYWISGNRFGEASSQNVAIAGGQGGHITGNEFSVAGTGLSLTSTGGNVYLADTEIVGNVLRASGQDISVVRSGAFSSARHRGLTLRGNKLLAGSILMQGINQPEIASSVLSGGSIIVFLDMANADSLKLLDNDIAAAATSGLNVVGVGSTLTGFDIRGGTIRNCTQRGILISFAAAVARAGRITGVSVIDCSRHDSDATDFSGITLLPGDAAGGVQDTVIDNNVIRCYSATSVNANKHAYGVEEVAGGQNNRNMIGRNFIKGYVTADVLLSGAASLDEVARLTLLDAQFGRYDGGVAV